MNELMLKPLAEALLYAYAERRYGRQAWTWPLGIHARFGVVLQIPRGVA